MSQEQLVGKQYAWKPETQLLVRDFLKTFKRDDVKARITFALERGIPEGECLRALLEASIYAPAGKQGMAALCDLMHFCEYDAKKFARMMDGIVAESRLTGERVPSTILPNLRTVKNLHTRVEEVMNGHSEWS